MEMSLEEEVLRLRVHEEKVKQRRLEQQAYLGRPKADPLPPKEEPVPTISVASPQQHTDAIHEKICIVISGPSGVGKSSLISQYVVEKMATKRNESDSSSVIWSPGGMHTKVGGKSVIKECQIDNADVYIELLEAGDDPSPEMALENVLRTKDNVSAIALVFSLTDRKSFARLEGFQPYIASGDKPLLIVANKADLQAQHTVEMDEVYELANDWAVRSLPQKILDDVTTEPKDVLDRDMLERLSPDRGVLASPTTATSIESATRIFEGLARCTLMPPSQWETVFPSQDTSVWSKFEKGWNAWIKSFSSDDEPNKQASTDENAPKL